MKKIRRVWEENKVLLVLAIILVICLVVFAGVAITYFYGSSDSESGNRLDITEEVPLNDKLLEDIKEEVELNENVKSIKVDFQNLKKLVVYISIEYIAGTKMNDAKKIAEDVIKLFNEDELQVYDIHFTIKTASTDDLVAYTLMGSRNASGSGNVIWGNYNIEESSDSE